MKKLLTALLIVVAAFSTAFAFSACDLFNTGDSGDTTQNGGTSDGSTSSGNNTPSGGSSGGTTTPNGGTSSGSNPHVCKYEFSSTVPADCLNGGYDLYKCTCGKTEERNSKKALGHDYKYTTHNATCITDWSQEWTCSRCGDHGSQFVPDSKKHTYGEYVSNGDATCVKDGTKTAKCTLCGVENTIADKGSATGEHTFGEYIPNNNGTCEKDGTGTAKCLNCLATDTKTIPNSKGSHDMKWTVVEETCTSTQKNGVCNICGYLETYYEVVYDDWGRHDFNWTETHNATCTMDGFRNGTCKKCGMGHTEFFKATGHKAGSNNKCTVCGETVGIHTRKMNFTIATTSDTLNFGTVYFEFVLIKTENKANGLGAMQYDMYVVQTYDKDGKTNIERTKVTFERPNEPSRFTIKLRNLSNNQLVELEGVADYSVVTSERMIAFKVWGSGSVGSGSSKIDYQYNVDEDFNY